MSGSMYLTHFTFSLACFREFWGWELLTFNIQSFSFLAAGFPLLLPGFLFPSLAVSLSLGAGVGIRSGFYSKSFPIGFFSVFFFPHCIWDGTLSIKPAGQSKCCLISFMPPAQTGFQPPCVVLPMNLNLVPKQLPSIILAATANSSPASHFSPLKRAFFPPCCDGIASLACLGNDFSAGSWTRRFPQVGRVNGCMCVFVCVGALLHVKTLFYCSSRSQDRGCSNASINVGKCKTTAYSWKCLH